jgi:hypothetical protein
MSKTTADRFIALMDMLEFYEPDTDDYLAIADEIRSLPGHPMHTDENDFIRWEITTSHA